MYVSTEKNLHLYLVAVYTISELSYISGILSLCSFGGILIFTIQKINKGTAMIRFNIDKNGLCGDKCRHPIHSSREVFIGSIACSECKFIETFSAKHKYIMCREQELATRGKKYKKEQQ